MLIFGIDLGLDVTTLGQSGGKMKGRFHFVILLALAFGIGCERSEKCRSVSANVSATLGRIVFAQCNDDSQRELRCQRVEGSWDCQCRINDVTQRLITQKAPPPSRGPEARDTANALCSWRLERD